MKWQNLNEGVVTFFHQTKSNSFDDASVIIEGTSVRDKVNLLWQSIRLLEYFYMPHKSFHWKTKKEWKLEIPSSLYTRVSIYKKTELCPPNLGSQPCCLCAVLALGIDADRQVFILVWELDSVISKWANNTRHLTSICCLIAYFNTLNCEVNLIM